jgi:carboxyl-terminal processing protease
MSAVTHVSCFLSGDHSYLPLPFWTLVCRALHRRSSRWPGMPGTLPARLTAEVREGYDTTADGAARQAVLGSAVDPVGEEGRLSEQQSPMGTSQAPQPWGASARPRAGSAAREAFSLVVTALLVALAFSAGWFGNAHVDQDHQIPASMQPYISEITQAWRLVDERYVDPGAINHQKMAYAGMSGIVDSLGDTGHSRFETPAEVKQENSSLHNAPTVGIGVLLSGGGTRPLRIDEVFPGSAADGHLMPGDVIIAVNGKDITGKTIDQVRPLIVGTQGTAVTLTIRRQGEAKPLDITLTRKPFTVPLVSSYVIPGVHLADIQLTQFAESLTDPNDNTDTQLVAALKQAKSQGATGIILDLRDNPGGYLDQAVSVASEFITVAPGHTVYVARTRTSRTPVPVESGHQLATNLPLVILVNGGTASAAEIVTAAISYNRPDVHVVGAHTFGTDTILTSVPLADGSVVLLGTAGWLTPSGANIQTTGIVPDQKVALPDGVNQITPIVANEGHLTAAQLLASPDTQLQQAIQDLTH